ncbi:hypothetical protein oki421_15300 [Helicobacter pylori]
MRILKSGAMNALWAIFAHDETKRLSTSILNSCVKRIDYIIGIVNEDSTTRGAEVQRSVFALKIDHDTIGIDEEGALKVEGVCAQKGSQEYEELVNKNTWHFTHSTRLGQPKLIERKN